MSTPLPTTTQESDEQVVTTTFQGPQAPTTEDPHSGLLVVVYPDHTLAVATTKDNEHLVAGRAEVEEDGNTDEEASFQHPLLQTNPSTMYMRLARYYSNPMRTRRRKFLVSLFITYYTYKYIQIHTNTYKYIQIHTNTYKYIHIHLNFMRVYCFCIVVF